jgi:excisionase family DNA binding protein
MPGAWFEKLCAFFVGAMRGKNMNQKKLAAIIGETIREAAKPEPPALVDMPETCRQLAISKPTGYRLLKKGILKPVHLPGIRVTRFRRSDVLALVGR